MCVNFQFYIHTFISFIFSTEYIYHHTKYNGMKKKKKTRKTWETQLYACTVRKNEVRAPENFSLKQIARWDAKQVERRTHGRNSSCGMSPLTNRGREKERKDAEYLKDIAAFCHLSVSFFLTLSRV